MYPNTLLDIEISMHEPLLQFLPRPGKPRLYRVAGAVVLLVYAAAALLLALAAR